MCHCGAIYDHLDYDANIATDEVCNFKKHGTVIFKNTMIEVCNTMIEVRKLNGQYDAHLK